MFRSYRIDNEIEAASVLLHRPLIARQHDFVSAEPLRIRGFARRRGKEHHLRAESVRQFDRHVSESAESNHAHLLSFAHLPMPKRRVGCDPRA